MDGGDVHMVHALTNHLTIKQWASSIGSTDNAITRLNLVTYVSGNRQDAW